ncbi:MAG: TraR/DksA family transcriptional regulator [Candidatus Falkowbacteria bacterium]|nr:TraR/DksA family transcriptional regulator [Candidatus Falkowbacteria bacterium]
MKEQTENTTMISAEEITKIEKALMAQKKQIMEDLKDISGEDSHEADNIGAKFPEYGDKPDENAQEISDYTTNLATEKVLESTIKDIDSTLSRIQKGVYGVCKYCGKPIAPKRLIARPTASSCVECKTELQENE